MALRNPFSRAARERPVVQLEKARDDRPKRGLFAEPIRITELVALDPEPLDDGLHRVTFRLEVRDAEGRRCPELAVEARFTGPGADRVLEGATDMFGRLRFRMDGPAGTYAVTVNDVAAFGLDWDASAGPTEVSLTVP